MKLDPVPNAPEWLKKCPKTGHFYVSKYRADLPQPRLERRVRSQVGLDDKLTLTQAKRFGEQMIAEWISGNLPKKRKRVTMAFAVAQFTAYRKGRFEAGKIRARTWAHDRAWLPNIEKWFGSSDPRQIDENAWEAWLEETGSLMNRTHADTAKYLSMTLAFCLKNKWIDRKPVIRNPDESEYKGRNYTDEEVASLFAAADPVMREQIRFGFECGMRTHEVRELRWDMVKFEGRGAETPTGAILTLPDWFSKTGEAREFRVSTGCFDVLLSRLDGRGSLPFVWPSRHSPESAESDSSFYSRFRAAVEKSGIQGRARFYDLRHTFFNRLVFEKGMSLELVSEYGGNSPETLRANYLRRTASNTATIVGLIGIRDCGNPAGEDSDGSASA